MRDPDTPLDPGAEAAEQPSWSRKVEELQTARESRGDGAALAMGRSLMEGDAIEQGMELLRQDARTAAHRDAAEDKPATDDPNITEREASLQERCRAIFERWLLNERHRVRDELADREERISRLLGQAGLLLDRLDRLSSQLIRLKVRRSTRERQHHDKLESEGGRRPGLSTPVYLVAIAFLGVVEFFANAPVFSTLLPRDPLTERQIGVIAETSTGWIAGLERVLAQIVLRPDAALLAAGVVTFLCVLAHFFGHSLRELVMKKEDVGPGDSNTTATENVIPMVLTCLGLVLVLGVLFQARVILGDVGERRHQDDMGVVAELRREAGWLRTDGELLQANQLADRADDMEAAAAQLLEYAQSMARMTYPILLLNLTLVIAAITAAYFHRRDDTPDVFADGSFEHDRDTIIDSAESTATEISNTLSQARRPIRELATMAGEGFSHDPGSVARRLDTVIALYRQENARRRGLQTERIAAFAKPAHLDLVLDGRAEMNLTGFQRLADEAEQEHRALSERFTEARSRFATQLHSWEAGAGRSDD